VRLAPSKLADLLHVSAYYGNRPEIFTRASWPVLTTLAAPNMPTAIRIGFEAKIAAGERITIAEIKRATEAETCAA
jgi:hypothetical protein